MTSSLKALEAAYGGVCNIMQGLDEAQSWQPTRCAGWVVRDLILHMLEDAQRGLVALATPAAVAAPDKNSITYWIDAPGAADAASQGIRALRSMASQFDLTYLISLYVQTAAGTQLQARRTSPDEIVTTQGHTLRVDDLLTTLAVEATIHHLDMIVHLDAPGPAPAALAAVRATLDGLLGHPSPTSWSDTDWALVATGRTSPTTTHTQALGASIERLPLLR